MVTQLSPLNLALAGIPLQGYEGVTALRSRNQTALELLDISQRRQMTMEFSATFFVTDPAGNMLTNTPSTLRDCKRYLVSVSYFSIGTCILVCTEYFNYI